MKQFVILLLVLSFSSCDYFSDDHEDFIEAYKNILIVRDKYQNDSLKAKKEINKIYDKYGYSAASFKEEFFSFANEEPRKFYELLDSIRSMAADELTKSLKSKSEKRKKDSTSEED